MRRGALLATGAAVLLALVACTSAPAPSDPGSAPDGPGAEDPVSIAAALLQSRYELVRDGDYAGACALYSPGYISSLAELAEVETDDCVEVHQAAADNVAEYLATAEQQGRGGLTPFFYVPTEISIDASKITSDDPDVAVAAAGAVVSDDPREFEDGVGKTPGWLSGVIYVVRGDDATWRLAAPGER